MQDGAPLLDERRAPTLRRKHKRVGRERARTKEVTTEDGRRFARLTGEPNRLHLDEAFAAPRQFEGRIIQKLMLAGLIGTAISRLPELSLSQQLKFLPRPAGETLRNVCEMVKEVDEQ